MSRPDAAPLVLTGATGFVGRELVRQLAAMEGGGDRSITLLVSHPGSIPPEMRVPPTWTIVGCDLSDPQAVLPPGTLPVGCVVLHLAAITGRAPAHLMRQVNVGGTQLLAEAARRAGARHFVMVSSIAAGYPNQRWYPYAATKRAAEAVALAAGLPVSIVRPTVVFGPGSRVQEGLERLATGPLPIVLGGGEVLVQPVDVRDLAGFLLALSDQPAAGTVPVEVGGREPWPMGTLLDRMRAARGLPARGHWPVPLGLLRLGLAAVESLLGPRLPVTAGQLAAFLNDSAATAHPLVEGLLPSGDPLRSLATAPTSGATPLAGPVAEESTLLEQEFRVFAAHLGTVAPPPESLAAYRRGHRGAVAVPADGLDLRLSRVARRSPTWCALADCYARLARPHGVLRRKLVLTLAVLEAGPGTHREYDRSVAAPTPVAWTAVCWQGVRWTVLVLAAVLLLGPGHLLEPRHGAKAPVRHG